MGFIPGRKKVFAVVVLLFGVRAWAVPIASAEAVGPGPDWPFSLSVPNGWKSDNDCVGEFCSVKNAEGYISWRISFYHRQTLWDSVQSSMSHPKGWAQVRIVFEAFEYLNSENYQSWKKSGDCEMPKISSFGDYASGLSCSGEKSCTPIEAPCSKLLSEMDLPLGKGYLFESIGESYTDDAPVPIRELVILYDVPGAGGVHRLHLIVPEEFYDHYLPFYQKMVESYRINPGEARR